MKRLLEDVRRFHAACDVPILEFPQFPSQDRVDLRLRLGDEEQAELREACESADIVKVADALADIVYIAVGSALEFGIPLDRVWDEVHRSNMMKADPVTGKANHREDGKVLKPDGWRPPDIKSVLAL